MPENRQPVCKWKIYALEHVNQLYSKSENRPAKTTNITVTAITEIKGPKRQRVFQIDWNWFDLNC